MELELHTLPKINTDIKDYEMICTCSHAHEIVILWGMKLTDGYQYVLKKYSSSFEELSSCEFRKKLHYDVIRMYRNVCILVNLAGGYEQQRFLKNALLITPQGIQLKEFPIGIGINAISISPQGTLWCGYDNEGHYKEFLPNISKGNNCIIAAWNFFGELIYELDCPVYDNDFGFFHDCYSIYAKSNDEVYFFYYDKFDLCQIKNLKEKNLISFFKDHERPFNFTIKDNFIWILFEPFVNDLKSLKRYEIKHQQLHYKDTIQILLNEKKLNDYQAYFNEDVLLIQHHHELYYYQI